MKGTPGQAYRIVVVAPVYDDAAAAARLVAELGHAFAHSDVNLRMLLVDDGSPVPVAQQLESLLPPSSPRVNVLRLRRNVGHQRAIALGAAFVHEYFDSDAMLVMDADGEDRPEDAAKLVARCRFENGERVIFAERTRRSETALFQILYRCYQLLHWLLTGVRVRVGNFSVVPAARLPALVTLPALWNHYAAAIFQARLPRELIPTTRGTRYAGRSRMNLVSLVMHGLQAISVFIDVVTVRLLLSICGIAGCAGVALLASLAARWLGYETARAWASVVSGSVFVLAASLAFGCFSLTLASLAKRNNFDFIPIRDYRFFVEGLQPVAASDDSIPHTNNVVPLAEGPTPLFEHPDFTTAPTPA